jgi:hypothetical protein
MYEALEQYDMDWLVPGLGLLPATDFVTVLSTNNEFTESFLVGLSDEMGRELLWRGYPTDQRGTYFHRFWNRRSDELAKPVHQFTRTPLGSHITLGTGDGAANKTGKAVIVVKSELVRRFPDLIVQAAKNQAGAGEEPVFEKEGSPAILATELFSVPLQPDITLVGLDLTPQQLNDDDWWILIAEHPGATRFGRDRDDAGANPDAPGAPAYYTDMPAASADEFADLTLHRPVRIAFQADDLIKTEA